MNESDGATGRRERNKRDKFERITRAAAELFAQHGVDAVTTQQIANRADVGAGTLFLYARSKAELLLLVQNDAYAAALNVGRVNAPLATSPASAVMAVLEPVVRCNRDRVDVGRAYLKEVVFGDASEPNRRQALALVAATQELLADELRRRGAAVGDRADVLAGAVSAVMLVLLTRSENVARPLAALLDDLEVQVRALLGP